MNETIYPMWLVKCQSCGPVATVWEKPGTGCKYIEHCPNCGRRTGVSTERVENVDEHEQFKKRAVKQRLTA